jgi:tetratricopeptide (TPR) repeat protein
MPARTVAKSSVSAAALGFEASPGQTPATGDAASPASLARLEAAIAELKALTVAPMLRRAIDALRDEDAKAGADWALKALNQDPKSGMAWYVLAVAREKAGDFASSLQAYEAAITLLPDESEVANDLGRLAFRMGMKDVAEQLYRRYLARHPDAVGTMSNLASAVRDQGRASEAIEILRAAVKLCPTDATLWNTLGTVVMEQGDLMTAIIFFDEALRLDPDSPQPRYNRGNAKLELGQQDDALADCEAAMKQVKAADERLMMQLARSTIKIAQGRIGEGWDDYEARLDPQFSNATVFLVDAPLWTPDADLTGKRLLVMGEQGLGDEVLFANMLPDVVEALGPNGKLILGVEARLVALFQRSYPDAEVVGHLTYRQNGRNYRGAAELENRKDIDLWAPIGSLLRRFRRNLSDFPQRDRFLVPDPQRVAHWRGLLQTAPPGRKVGLLWKSMKLDSARARYYAPFELWGPLLKTPGASFVNIQYGDCSAEIAWAETLGVKVWTPPGIDLKDDLDDIAALTSALDLTLGFANATSNIAAACGAPVWIISVPGAWTRLGTDRMPWYPQARIFTPDSFQQWDAAMASVAKSLAAL